MAKYGALREDWDFPNVTNRSSAFWKGLMSIKDSFMASVGMEEEFVSGLICG